MSRRLDVTSQIFIIMAGGFHANQNHLSGAETFDHLCQIDPQVRVLLSSGYSEEDARSRLVPGDNLVGLIQKPFEWEALLAKISGR